MKNTIRIFVSLIALTFAASAEAKNSLPSRDIVIGINEVFVPGGFDSQADAYVVVSGIFPNSCYKWKGSNVKHVTSHEHEVVSYASVTQGMCLQVLMPFSKDARLGQLSTGTHTLKFLAGDGTYMEKQLVVE